MQWYCTFLAYNKGLAKQMSINSELNIFCPRDSCYECCVKTDRSNGKEKHNRSNLTGIQINHPLKSVAKENIKAIKHHLMYLAGTYVKNLGLFALYFHVKATEYKKSLINKTRRYCFGAYKPSWTCNTKICFNKRQCIRNKTSTF